MLDKITTKLAVFALLALLFLPAHLSEAFTDTNNHTNEDAIDYLYDKGVVEGYGDGSYAPENTINRAEFVKILIESRYPDEATGANCFLDVGTEWYAKYVCYAKDLGIIDGYDDNYFRPSNDINLAEALKVVLETYEFDVCTSCYSIWYESYYWKAYPLDLLDRILTDISHEVTRGEMAQFVYNVEKYLDEDVSEENGEDDDEPTYANGKECFLYDDNETYVYDYWELLDDYNYDVFYEDDEISSDEECSQYAEERYDEDEDGADDSATTDLTFDDTKNAETIPNVVILEFAEDDEWRNSNGNIDMEGLVERFYDDQDDEFDMLYVITVNDEYEDLYNGVTNGSIHRYGPSNIGHSNSNSSDGADYCSMADNSDCTGFPERLRYIQQSGDNYSGYIFKHELGHYWSADWYEGKNDACYEEWVQNAMYNGHWTQLAVFGETTSPVSYFLTSGAGDTYFGEFTDNNDGTFIHLGYSGGNSELLESAAGNTRQSDLRFHYMDLYAMGLMDEVDLSSRDMYAITDPEFVSYSNGETVITGNRADVNLDDFKSLLLEKESCEGTGENYYFTGDGSRESHGDDPNPDFAENLKVGIVLIKFPDEPIPNSQAYEICQVVNYEWPEYWSDATYGLSTLDIKIDGDDSTPNCADLYAE